MERLIGELLHLAHTAKAARATGRHDDANDLGERIVGMLNEHSERLREVGALCSAMRRYTELLVAK